MLPSGGRTATPVTQDPRCSMQNRAPLALGRRVLAAAARLRAAAPRALSAAASPASDPTAPVAPAPTDRRKRVLSGVQPTGSLHLGNYLGAIRNWVALQEEYDTYFMVVDLHAITLPHDPAELRAATRSSAALYMAAGIDPEKAQVFVQSHVPAHAELAWMLSCVTPIGWLRKMIQFKEKSKKAGGEEVGTGLLTYPVLMAADILLYQSDLVPVGEDQRQHLELARDLAERTNYLYGGKKAKKMGCRHTRLFKVPDAFIPPAGARVMSLQDGTSKMSKSAESDLTRINLLDSPDEVMNKVKRAKTDAFEGLEWDNPERPEAKNLLTIYQCVTGLSKEAVAADVAGLRWGEFKPRLGEAVVAHLEPIQRRYAEVMEDPGALDTVLAAGAEAAAAEANATLDNVRQAMGFVNARR
jgi:tryptophanyl-tRNA synthetase